MYGKLSVYLNSIVYILTTSVYLCVYIFGLKLDSCDLIISFKSLKRRKNHTKALFFACLGKSVAKLIYGFVILFLINYITIGKCNGLHHLTSVFLVLIYPNHVVV